MYVPSYITYALTCSAAKIEPPLDPEALKGLIRLKLSGPGGSVKLLAEILALCPDLTRLVFNKSSLVTYSILKQVLLPVTSLIEISFSRNFSLAASLL
jgi:hypothetical protein